MHSSTALAEQFDDLEQQHESSSFGMWVFLATEVMFFGGLFTAYVIFRNLYLPAFELVAVCWTSALEPSIQRYCCAVA